MESEGHHTEVIKSEDIVLPHFRSTVPPHLLEKLPADDRYLLETLSVLEGKSEWTFEQIIYLLQHKRRLSFSLDSEVTRLSSRIIQLEQKLEELLKWKSVLMGKVGIIIGIVTISGPWLLKLLWNMIEHLLKP